MREAQQSRDRKQLAELEVERKELFGPVYELFDQMEERLMALLTTAQKDRSKSAKKSSDSKPAVRTVRDRDTGKTDKPHPASSDATKNENDKDDSY